MGYPRRRVALTLGAVLAVATTILLAGSAGSAAAAPQYDISTLAGKVAFVAGACALGPLLWMRLLTLYRTSLLAFADGRHAVNTFGFL